MLHLYDVNKNKIAAITNHIDLNIESDLSTSDKTLSFSLPINDEAYTFIKEECYIRTKSDEFIVKEINETLEYIDVKATMNVEALEGSPFEHFDTTEKTITECINLALAGTGWTIGTCNVTKRRTVRKTNCSSWDIIQEAKKVYKCDIVFDTLNKRINIYDRLGEDKGAYFIEDLNIKALNIQRNSYDFYTRIIPIGKDGLTIESVNSNKKYVENHQYSSKVKTLIWKDERYTDINSLKEDAILKLNELSKPYRAYSCDIDDLARSNKEEYQILDFSLGDTIILISKTNNVKEKQRIVRIVEYPYDPERNSCEIANSILRFEDVQKEFQEATDTVKNITTDNGTINGSTIDGIETGQIKEFDAQVNRVVNLTAINAEIENLKADKADIGSLNAVEAKIGTLEATTAKITDLNATNANIENLQATTAKIVDLEATNAKIGVLEAGVAKIGVIEADMATIKNLVSGNISSDNIQTGGITGDNLNMSTIFVNDANIITVNASKINAGELDTSKVVIRSSDGGMRLVGATQQFLDKNNRIRIQLGKDQQGNFDFYILAENGNILFNTRGITGNAIENGLIKENMVADGAVGGKKINWSSFSTEFNSSTNTTKLNSSKILLDGTNQTLNVAFNEVNSKVDNIQVGGRNLLVGSKINRTTSEYLIANINLADEKPKHGDEITISIKGELNKQKSYFAVYNSGGSVHMASLRHETRNSDGVYLITFKWRIEHPQYPAANTHISIYHMSSSDVVTSKIEWVKLEKGNKATDWTPAPEDIQSQFDSHTTQLNIEKGRIDTLIQDTTIVKDGQTVKLKDEYSKLEQTVSGISTTVGSQQTVINQHTGQITSTTTKVSQLEQSVSGLSSKVTETTTKVDSLQVGGRNLLIGDKLATYTSYNTLTSKDTTKKIVSTYVSSYTGGTFTLRVEGYTPPRGQYTISGYVKVNGAKPSSKFFTGLSNSYGSDLVENYYNQQDGYFRITQTYNGESVWVFHAFTTRKSGATDVIELTDLKFEKGNKATDWTPAPEDIDSSINVVDGKVTTTSNKVSQIEQSVNSITQRVSSTETTVTNHTTQLNSVDGKIDNAKSQAITEAIGIKDTRSNNENPQWYISNYPQKTVTEFKMANVLGLPSSLGSMYGTVETKVPWANTSGGYPTQTWRANGSATYERKGVSTTDWGPWVQIEDVNGSQGKVNSAKTELNAEITKVSDKTAELKTSIDGITQRVSSTESITTKLTTDLNLTTSLAQAMSSGKPIKTDPTFKNGTNGCGIYNNSGGSTVTFNRISKPSDCPTTSTHCLEIKTIGSPTSPGWGGFHCAVSSRANAKFIVKIMAKIPSDRTLHLASNSMGTGYSDRLITSNSGTGNYTEYIREIKCGSAGTFSSGGHFYLSGGSAPTASSPIIWYVASCEVIDVTDSDYTLQETVAEVNSVKSKTATLETNLNSITGRVSSVETTTSTINGNVSNLQTRMNTAEQKITATAITNSVSEAINNGSSSINTVTTVLDRNGFTVKNGKIIVKNSSNKDVMWVDTTGKLTTDNLEVYGSGGSTIRMSGTGSKSLVLESSDNWDVFLNFKSNANGGRIGTYKGRDHQLFVEAGAIGSSVRPLVIYRGINSTTSTNQVCDVEIHGRLKVTDNVTSKFGYMVASDTINQLIIQTKSNGSKYIHINSDIGVYGVDIWNSDAYIKENFNYAKAKALDKIMKIEHAEYNYIEGTHREVGVVAQQLQLIDENWVNEVVEFDENKKPTGHTLLQPVAHEILPYITKSIQEQQNEIEYLKEKIKILENKLISLQI